MKTNKFSLSNYKLFTGRMGELIPCGIQETLPGDTFQQASSVFLRLNTMVRPVMHPLHVRLHHFFVPYRLIWEDFEAFITGGTDGEGDGAVYPTIDWGANDPAEGTLGDYLGIPANPGGLVTSALPFRAYALIYNEYFRDQDLVNPLTIEKTSGADTTTNRNLQLIAWEKDYFTSARETASKGTDITIPSSGQAPVYGATLGAAGVDKTAWQGYNSTDTATQFGSIDKQAGTALLQPGTPWTGIAAADTVTGISLGTQAQYTSLGGDFEPPFASLSGATGLPSINELREAFALWRFQEARSMWGSRYTEYLRYLGITPSDARLQRPEYLGGGKQTVQISEVLQQSNTTSGTGVTGVGNLAGHGIGSMRTNRYRRFFEEHGIVVSMFSVRPKSMYVQGLPRLWNRRTKEDFFQKELQHIGQQEVLMKELYGPTLTPDAVFGYQDRYDEYRRCESTIAGEMRSTTSPWHFARQFTTDPVLNQSFIECGPTQNPFQVQTGDNIQVMVNHSIQARRPIAKVGRGMVL